MKRSNLSKEKYKLQFEEKRGTRECKGTKSFIQGYKQRKKRKSLRLNVLKGVVTSWQDPTHLNFQLMKRNAEAGRSEFEINLIYRGTSRTAKLRQCRKSSKPGSW